MIEVGELFPRVISRPITVREAIGKLAKKRSHLALTDINYWNGKDLGRFSSIKVVPNKPSPTISKNQRPKSSHCGLNHWLYPQSLDIIELARLNSFPDTMTFIGKYSTSAARIGNSVPPLLMKAVATQIYHKLWEGNSLTRYPKTMTYPEILEAAWQDHLAPRDPDAPTVISTFAGGGGSSLGYSMAGYRELLAVEWDDNAVATFKLNFPDVPVYHGDIAKLSVEECMQMAELTVEGELDLLDGSPPCQGMSMAGKRNLNDPRNQLFREFVRLLRGLKPKVFVMENVPGLVKGKMKLIFAEIMRELKASGYQVKCKKLNAMYFYVPQNRERLIFIGVRNDFRIEPSYPGAENRPIVVKNALDGVTTTNELTFVQKTWWEKLKPGQSGSYVHPDGHWFNFLKLSPLQICPTILKESGSAKFCYWDKPFGLSVEGYKRIGAFPNGFEFKGGYSKEKNCIGNSVPPFLMRSIAEHIRKYLITDA